MGINAKIVHGELTQIQTMELLAQTVQQEVQLKTMELLMKGSVVRVKTIDIK